MDILKTFEGRNVGLGFNSEIVINRKDGYQEVLGASVYKQITSAQLLALNATPITLVAAPGAGLAIVPVKMVIYKPAGVAYAGVAVGEDLVAKYTNGSGAQATGVIETTGFLDQTTAQTRYVWGPGASGATAGDVTPVANAALVLHLLTGEIITGDQPLHVRVWYDLIKTVFTS